jgi:SAM-dependent methyltransferase
MAKPEAGSLTLVCPICHGMLESTTRKGFLCVSCGSDFPAYSETVPVLVRQQDIPLVHSWLGGTPGRVDAFEKYVEVRTSSPLTVMYYDWWLGRMIAMIPADNVGPVAELMCGRAEVTRRLPARFSVAAATDLNLMVCQAARQDLEAMGKGGVEVFCASAGCLPIEDESVGTVVIQGALHHARPILNDIFREIYRVLKPGGLFVGSEPANDSHAIRLLRRVQYKLSSLQGNDPDEDGFTRDELSRGLAASGLRMESYLQFGTIAYVLMGNTDLVPILARSQNMALGRALLWVDEYLERLPLIRNLGMASLFSARKGENSGKTSG